MAAARTYRTKLHEVWVDAVPHDGAVTQTLATNISFKTGEANEIIDADLTLANLIGAPVFTVTLSHVNELLVVSVANTAAAGNSATWSLDIRYIHTYIR